MHKHVLSAAAPGWTGKTGKTARCTGGECLPGQ